MSEIVVELVYVDPDQQILIEQSVKQGASVADAIAQSNICERYQIESPHDQMVGIFGQRCDLDCTLGHGDRIEIYRELTMDPKEIRRKRMLNKLAQDE